MCHAEMNHATSTLHISLSSHFFNSKVAGGWRLSWAWARFTLLKYHNIGYTPRTEISFRLYSSRAGDTAAVVRDQSAPHSCATAVKFIKSLVIRHLDILGVRTWKCCGWAERDPEVLIHLGTVMMAKSRHRAASPATADDTNAGGQPYPLRVFVRTINNTTMMIDEMSQTVDDEHTLLVPHPENHTSACTIFFTSLFFLVLPVVAGGVAADVAATGEAEEAGVAGSTTGPVPLTVKAVDRAATVATGEEEGVAGVWITTVALAWWWVC